MLPTQSYPCWPCHPVPAQIHKEGLLSVYLQLTSVTGRQQNAGAAAAHGWDRRGLQRMLPERSCAPTQIPGGTAVLYLSFNIQPFSEVELQSSSLLFSFYKQLNCYGFYGQAFFTCVFLMTAHNFMDSWQPCIDVS